MIYLSGVLTGLIIGIAATLFGGLMFQFYRIHKDNARRNKNNH